MILDLVLVEVGMSPDAARPELRTLSARSMERTELGTAAPSERAQTGGRRVDASGGCWLRAGLEDSEPRG